MRFGGSRILLTCLLQLMVPSVLAAALDACIAAIAMAPRDGGTVVFFTVRWPVTIGARSVGQRCFTEIYAAKGFAPAANSKGLCATFIWFAICKGLSTNYCFYSLSKSLFAGSFVIYEESLYVFV